MNRTSILTTADIPESKRFAFWRDAIWNRYLRIDCVRTSAEPFAGELVTTRVNEVSFSRVRGRGAVRYTRTPHHIGRASEGCVHIVLNLGGTWYLAADGREASLKPGDFVCFDSTRPCLSSYYGNFDHILLEIPREIWIKKIAQTEQLTARAVCGATPMGSLVANFLRQAMAVAEHAEPATADRLTEVSMHLVATALGEVISKPEIGETAGRVALLYRAKATIEGNLHDPSLNSEWVARSLGISLRYLQVLFKAENTTASNWIWEQRLMKSRRDLADPLLMSKSVTQIAFDCGFNSFSHFCHSFKAAFSVTPSELRQNSSASRPD